MVFCACIAPAALKASNLKPPTSHGFGFAPSGCAASEKQFEIPGNTRKNPCGPEPETFATLSGPSVVMLVLTGDQVGSLRSFAPSRVSLADKGRQRSASRPESLLARRTPRAGTNSVASGVPSLFVSSSRTKPRFGPVSCERRMTVEFPGWLKASEANSMMPRT